MLLDDYGYVVNGEATSNEIANVLAISGSIIISWTDGRSTVHDILFTLAPIAVNHLGGGLSPYYLYVSVMRVGAWGFQLNDTYSPEHVAEKLNMTPGVTAERLTELINAVLNP